MSTDPASPCEPDDGGAGPTVCLGTIAGGTLGAGTCLRSAPMLPVLAVGPTGSGKTRGLAVPTVRDWPGAAVVLSTKSDVAEATYRERLERGPVYVLDPEDALAGRFPTASFDLAAWTGSLTDAQDLAAILIGAGAASGAQDAPFWYQLAETWTAAILFAGSQAGLRFDEIVDMILEDRSARARLLVAETGNIIAQRMLASVYGLEDRARSGVLATVAQALRVFNRPGVIASVIGSDFTLSGLLETGGTLMLVQPGFRMDQLTPFFAALLVRLWSEVEKRSGAGSPLPSPLLMLIDEAAHVPAVTQHLLEWSSTARGLGVQLVTLWQDVGQLRARFGDETATLLNNTGSTVILGTGRDPDGHDYLVRLTAASSGSATTAAQARSLLARVPRDGQLVLADGRPPEFVRLPGLAQLRGSDDDAGQRRSRPGRRPRSRPGNSSR